MCCCHESGRNHRQRTCCGGESTGCHPVFWTKEAKLSWLESYLSSLEEETKSVQNRLQELRSEA